MKPRIAVLPGDPSGIGPEMMVKLLARAPNLDAAEVLLIADPLVLESGQRIAGGGALEPLRLQSLDGLRFEPATNACRTKSAACLGQTPMRTVSSMVMSKKR